MKKEKHVLVLTYWSFADALIQTYTLPYLKIILQVLPKKSAIFLVTLEKAGHSKIQKATLDELNKEGIHLISVDYKPFGILGFWMWVKLGARLIVKVMREKISIIHCWGTPAGAIGVLLSLLLKRKLIIDSYEPHAEAMVENGTWKKNGLPFRILFFLEKLQSKKAAHVICAAHGMDNYAKKKYDVNLKNVFVKPACVNLELFSDTDIKDKQLLKELNLHNKIVALYAGKFGGIYLDKEVFQFLKLAHLHWGDKLRVLLLTNQNNREIERWCTETGLPTDIVIIRFVRHEKIPKYMGLANFAITPVKPVPTKRYCTPIKDGEYWAMGLPVVIPNNISEDSQVIENHDAGAVLYQLNDEAYREAIKKIDNILQEDNIIRYNRIRGLAVKYRNFSIAEDVYSKVYRTLN
ncbi:MAG: hypothetical protein ACKO96_26810 [Flammeovirgaceae bacterium]